MDLSLDSDRTQQSRTPTRAADFSQVLAQAQYTETDPPAKDPEDQLKWAAQQLEIFFARELLTSMRRTIPEGGLFAKNFAGELYEEMLWDEWAKTLASTGSLGLSELILSQLRG